MASFLLTYEVADFNSRLGNEALHERGLPNPGLTDQRGDLAGADFQNGVDSCAGPHRAGEPPVTRRAIRFELSGELWVDAKLGLVSDQQARDAHGLCPSEVAIDHEEVGHRNRSEVYEQARQVRHDRLGHPTY